MHVLLNSLNKLPTLLGFTVLLAFIGLLSFAVRFFWLHVLIRFSRKTATNLDQRLFEATRDPVQMVFIGAGLKFSWNLYGEAIMKIEMPVPDLIGDFCKFPP